MTQFPEDEDGDALRVVARRADMSSPMTIDFMVAIPSEAAGNEIGRLASTLGYSVSVEQDEQTLKWTCYCSKRMLATHQGVVDAQRELDRISAPFGGRSDGWGTHGNREESRFK